MKKNTIIAILCLISYLAVTNVQAQAADHSFNYQGELIDGGVPANGEYDILVQMVDGQGTDVGTASTHENTQVDNGLFDIDVKIGGISAFDGFENYYFEISVRPGASGGSFTVISPVQALQAVPLATNLVNGSATSGEVLTFNGFQWAPQAPANSPWIVNSTSVGYTAGSVGIGTTSPGQDFVINGTVNGDVVRVNVNGSTKFLVDDNGGVGIGSLSIPPVNGLDVEGDVKQPITSNGIMKYMVYADCGSGSSIERQFNGVNSGAISVTGSSIGRCTIDFPSDIDSRFWQVSINFGAATVSIPRTANCRIESTDKLFCNINDPVSDTFVNGSIMILIY